MAQWQQLLKLDSAHQDQVSQVYHEKFPREIRHYLSDWIESQNCLTAPKLNSGPLLPKMTTRMHIIKNQI
uniref:STAT transcription factor protein interaction domain-containing protein n=1 Tax=Myripristis murdjan TaxID=586833 RepID=A0A668AIX4_9TELE